MKTIEEKINLMSKFTDKYKEFSHNYIKREAECYAMQLPNILAPITKQELIVGNLEYLPIGFLPQASGGVGYYCDKNMISEMLLKATQEQCEQLSELTDFWDVNTTKFKIEETYTNEMLDKLTMGELTEPGVAFPLYRIAGVHMKPTKLLELGIDGLILHIQDMSMANKDFAYGLIKVLTTLSEVIMDLTKQCEGLSNMEKVAENLKHIAKNPPKTFWQATQLLWLFYLCSGTYNYGRMDDDLGSYLSHDLDNGVITEEEAIEIICDLWSRMQDLGTTWDARVILGGKGRTDEDSADRFALLAMESTRRLRQTLPQLTLRLYNGNNRKLCDKAFEVIGEGCTYPMLYNDDVNVKSVMKAFDIDVKTAEKYLPFGCGEYMIQNQSISTPSGAINLLQALNQWVVDKDALVSHNDFDSFYNGFISYLREYVIVLAQQQKAEYDIAGKEAAFLCYSLLYDNCIKKEMPLLSGGVKYLCGTLECYGNTNTADSLMAIKLLYKGGNVNPKTFVEALKNNFVGFDELRAKLLSIPKYGNDSSDADEMAKIFHVDLCNMIMQEGKKAGLDNYHAVVINNSMNTTFGISTGASADGRKANTFMANANNPTGGMDKNGITAMLNSLVKLPSDIHAGSVQNMRLSRELFTKMLPKTRVLLNTYFDNGGTQAMITVLNHDDLINARQNPEQYANLMVRVGGFSAKFVELSKEVQDEIMSRTLYG